MTTLAAPIFDFIALVVSMAILALAVAFVHLLVAQALDRPYRLRMPAARARARLRALPSTAPRTPRPQFADHGEIGLPGAA